MPRRMMDMAMRDSRNPYGSKGGYVTSRDPRRTRMNKRMRDRGMDYGHYGEHYMVRGGKHIPMDGNYPYSQYADERNSRNYEPDRQYDMARNDYGDMRDMHYGERQGNFRPVEAMGYFTGYYGGGDYGYPIYDYGDYGESLTKEELEHWCKKMMSKLEDREKQMLSKDSILQRAKSMGIQFEDFTEMEYYVNVVKNYTDHKKSIGENVDMAIKLARDDFFDEDGEYKGSEWLAVYYDTFIEDNT